MQSNITLVFVWNLVTKSLSISVSASHYLRCKSHNLDSGAKLSVRNIITPMPPLFLWIVQTSVFSVKVQALHKKVSYVRSQFKKLFS